MLHIRSILAPYDFSEHAERALDHAHAFAQLHGAHLDVLHVVEQAPVPAFDEEGRLDLYSEEPVLEPAREALASVGGRVGATTHVVRGVPYDEVRRFAEEHDTDLIVLATHGHTGLKRVLVGSVARMVIDVAPCPVFLLNAFGKSLLGGEAPASRKASSLS